jgi:Family of unknown function (DUF6283)
MKQHTKPCRECPFRRESAAAYLGGNDPKSFAFDATHEGHFPCHLTMSKPEPAQCAGRATMWANQCKISRDGSVMKLPVDREKVFGHAGQFLEHHKISMTPMELFTGEFE